MKKALLVIFSVLIADQVLKIWVKTHMIKNEAIRIFGTWFQIHFIENSGMALGLEFAGTYGKLFLSLFRILVVFALGYYILTKIRSKAHSGLIISCSLIFAGAIGNIIDSAFYGLIFTSSDDWAPAKIFPAQGYAPFLHGSVVDMLYFPIIHGHFPIWFPFWKGEDFEFFRPVFNIADSSITIGVALILIFQKSFFQSENQLESSMQNEDHNPIPEEPSQSGNPEINSVTT